MEFGEGFDYKNAVLVLRKAIGFYGEQAQWMMACEELGELIQAISKYNRKGKVMKNALAEEIADVLIMVWQIQLMADIDNESIIQRIKEKMERLEGRLEALGGKK